MPQSIWVLAFIDDPFDPPGEGLLGGGQSFIFDLGRSFVAAGFDVTFATRLNDPQKRRFEALGPRCRIHRIEAGDPRYKAGEELADDIDLLVSATTGLMRDALPVLAVHAQYWVSGVVAAAVKRELAVPFYLYPMSFGRAKRSAIDPHDRFALRREAEEPAMLSACDHIVVGTPHERDLARRHYPEIRDDQLLLAPLWCNSNMFSERPEPPDHYVRRAAARFAQGA
jgi:hypothetical protein